jgi:hypothetical protein
MYHTLDRNLLSKLTLAASVQVGAEELIIWGQEIGPMGKIAYVWKAETKLYKTGVEGPAGTSVKRYKIILQT